MLFLIANFNLINILHKSSFFQKMIALVLDFLNSFAKVAFKKIKKMNLFMKKKWKKI